MVPLRTALKQSAFTLANTKLVFPGQLNLNDLLELASRILPDDA